MTGQPVPKVSEENCFVMYGDVTNTVMRVIDLIDNRSCRCQE
jgi:hypothetical protein